jgi:hypothetical protein
VAGCGANTETFGLRQVDADLVAAVRVSFAFRPMGRNGDCGPRGARGRLMQEKLVGPTSDGHCRQLTRARA